MTSWKTTCALALGVVLTLWGATTSAQPVPAPLQPWIAWATQGQKDLACSQLQPGTHQCVWPGALSVKVQPEGGRFELRVWLEEDANVTLPGDTLMWPQDVKEGAAELVVGRVAGAPSVRLSAGQHTITGLLRWSSTPESMPVPASIGRAVIELSDGTRLDHPRLTAQGQLWLREARVEAAPEDGKGEDSLKVNVHRRFFDGVPLRVTHRFELNVTGPARQVSLGKVLFPNARPVGIRTPLPVRVGQDGAVDVYLRSGSHVIEIDTVNPDAPTEFKVPGHIREIFEEQEVWVWVANDTFRGLTLDGLQPVDSERTSLPSNWRGGATFLALPDQALTLKETHRGEVDPAPNIVRLNRTFWLDFDGRGYTVVDNLSGRMNRQWRLNYSNQGALGRVTQLSDFSELLITRQPDTGRDGVELRNSALSLEAALRLEDALDDLDIVGWDHDVQYLSAHVNAPPGWELLGAQGVDETPGTWIGSWTTFDIFFLLIMAVGVGALCGWPWGLLAALALLISHGYGEPPQWAWAHLLASWALLRVLPDGWWRRGVLVYRAGALLALVLVLAPYAQEQIRFALHPQVFENQSYSRKNAADDFLSSSIVEQDMLYEQEQAIQQRGPIGTTDIPAPSSGAWSRSASSQEGRKRAKADNRVVNGYRDQSKLQQLDTKTVIQTGPGVQRWSWNRWTLNWTGPVRTAPQVQLWWLSPAANRTMAIVRVLFLVLLAMVFLAPRDMRWQRRRKEDEDKDAKDNTNKRPWWRRALLWSALLATILPAALLVQPTEASAQDAFPPQGMLDTLAQRQRAATQCQGPCVVASQARMTIDNQGRFTLWAEVHVQRDSAWFLPGPGENIRPDAIKVDGQITNELRRDERGMIAVRLDQGRRVVEAQGALASAAVVKMEWDSNSRPMHLEVKAPDWSVDGLSPKGVADNTMRLALKETSEAPRQDEPLEKTSPLPPWFSVERVLTLDLPWQMVVTVRRDNNQTPQQVKMPLLEGEKVVTEGIEVEDDQAILNFPAGTSQIYYTSRVAISDILALKAPKERFWTETWTVFCGPIWSCQYSGLAPLYSVDPGTRQHKPRWTPWPGESLEITVKRPEGTPGQTVTIDEVLYNVTPGRRLLEASLKMSIRASEGRRQEITLPKDMELRSITINGQEQNIRPRDGVLDVPLKVGDQEIEVTWQQPWERSFYEAAPSVGLGGSAVNVKVRVMPGEARWLLWASGPKWGPAILFWGHLFMSALLALCLGLALRHLPLAPWEWLLLVVGMSQLPVITLAPVVAGFMALEWRQRKPLEQWWAFDLYQLVLVGLVMAMGLALYAALHTNLLLDVDMQVQGVGSTNSSLEWYIDQVDGQIPEVGIHSVPLLVWRGIMLLWALWLATRCIKWLPWAWKAFSHEGLWRMSYPKGDNTEDGGEKDAQNPQENTATTAEDTIEAPAAAQDAPAQADPSAEDTIEAPRETIEDLTQGDDGQDSDGAPEGAKEDT